MNNSQTITVRKDFDVILARSRTRDLARKMGMGTTDQARISLAASSAARALGLGGAHQGQIVITGLNGGGRVGVRVVCTTRDCTNRELRSRVFADARSMTDELTVKELPSGEVQVTLVKWAKRGTE
jgi:serine/threonine-protein kinase RsbT